MCTATQIEKALDYIETDLRAPQLMGISSLHPSYALGFCAAYPAPPWITPNQPRPLYVS